MKSSHSDHSCCHGCTVTRQNHLQSKFDKKTVGEYFLLIFLCMVLMYCWGFVFYKRGGCNLLGLWPVRVCTFKQALFLHSWGYNVSSANGTVC